MVEKSMESNIGMIIDKLDAIEASLDPLAKCFGTMKKEHKVKLQTMKHTNSILIQNKRSIDFNSEMVDSSKIQPPKLDCVHLCLAPLPRGAKLEKKKKRD